MIKLNLGCGLEKIEGWINIDISQNSAANIIMNLEERQLPMSDETVDEILADNFLEHVSNIVFVMNECWRVLKDGGKMTVIVPNALKNLNYALRDPTHVRYFTEDTFRYFANRMHTPMYGFKKWRVEILENEDFIKAELKKVKE